MNEVDPAADFRAQLNDLHLQVHKPPYKSLATHAEREGRKLPTSTTGALLKGRGIPRWDTVEAFVTACQRHAQTRRPPLALPGNLFSLHQWRTCYDQLKDGSPEMEEGHRGAGAGHNRFVRDWDPFALDVHHAITLDHPRSALELPRLPAYFRRTHDDELDKHLANITHSLMVMLIGGSSTGKSRALYEAIRRSVPDWLLLYPRTADELREVLTGPPPASGMVLWLTDTQHYLSGVSGELAAAALRRALDGSLSGPILAVSTLWPGYWDAFTTEPIDGEPDAHPQVRHLLRHAVHPVHVAERFRGEETTALTIDASIDPRLTAAATAAGDSGQVIQVLTGGPLLVDRHERPATASQRYAAAVVTVAMDAVRLGHHSPLPRVLLEDAAGAHLRDDDRVDPPHDWFSIGLTEATKAVHGIRALAPRRNAGVGPADGYQLHDYLDQHSRAARLSELPDRTLWEALVAHASDYDDRVRLAEAAGIRALYRVAVRLASPAADAGNTTAMLLSADVMHAAGRPDEIVPWLRRAADAGDFEAIWRVAELLQAVGKTEGARRWIRKAAMAGDTQAMLYLSGPPWNGEQLPEQGYRRTREEAQWLRRAVDAGDIDAIADVAEAMVHAGRPVEAEHLLRSGGFGSRTVHSLISLLEESGRKAEADQLLRRAAAAGDAIAMGRIIWRSNDDQQRTEVNNLISSVLDARSATAVRLLGSELESHGLVESARQLWLSAAETGNAYAMWRLADLLDDAGDVEQEVHWLHRAIRSGNANAMRRLAERLKTAKWDDEAEQVWRQPAEAGHPDAMVGLAEMLRDAGRDTEAEKWLRHAIEAGNRDAIGDLADLLEESGRHEEAELLQRCGIEPGGHTLEW